MKVASIDEEKTTKTLIQTVRLNRPALRADKRSADVGVGLQSSKNQLQISILNQNYLDAKILR